LVVDITGYHDKKMEAIKCFASQIHSADKNEPPTGISQPDFLAALEGRARHFGRLIGRTFGEPLLSRRPVPMADLLAHYELFPSIHPGINQG
jgi:hypothetical protein